MRFAGSILILIIKQKRGNAALLHLTVSYLLINRNTSTQMNASVAALQANNAV